MKSLKNSKVKTGKGKGKNKQTQTPNYGAIPSNVGFMGFNLNRLPAQFQG